MDKFFGEFKKFIARGNVIDMAVGIIVGSSFTAIVNTLSNNVLKPVTNYLIKLMIGADSLSEIYTFLGDKVYDAEGNIDLVESIYIDWGALINAIINFIVIAFVLFCIVRTLNNMRDNIEKLKKEKISKQDRKAMRKQGIKLRDKQAVKTYFDEKAKNDAALKAEAEEKARLEREANPTTEDLLKQIRDLLQATCK